MINSIFKVIAILLFLIIVTCGVIKIDDKNRGNYIIVLIVLAIVIGVL